MPATSPIKTEKLVVVLASPCAATNVVTNALRSAGIRTVLVVERPIPGRRLAMRRARRVGVRAVCGQVFFRIGAMPVLERRARPRIAEILATYQLDDSPVNPAVQVGSVNDEETRQVLMALSPALVVVVGTRIIGRSTLACLDAPFVNLHSGITPRYRGVHGGYWALVEGRPDLVGSSVHLVDSGIDTGLVLRQATFEVTGHDSFATYPFLHLAVGVPLVIEVVNEVLTGKELVGRAPMDSGDSRLWYHPTVWDYLAARRDRGVR